MIIRIAQRKLKQDGQTGSGDGANDDSVAWSQIEQSARSALRDIRNIIEKLDGAETAPLVVLENSEKKPGGEVGRQLGAAMEYHERALNLAGFHGNNVLAVAKGVGLDDPDVRSLVFDAIDELYGNVVRHGDSDGEYSLSVHVDASAVTITSGNVVKTGEDLSAGHGLKSLARRVRGHGGSLDSGMDGDEYYCYLVIPFLSPSPYTQHA